MTLNAVEESRGADLAKATLFEEVDHFIAGRFSREDKALSAVGASLRKQGIDDISVSPAIGKLLYLLASTCKATKILELGTLGGYSTIWMARAIAPSGLLISIEHNLDLARLARQNIERAGLSAIVEVRPGKAVEVMRTLIGESKYSFDMVFIDADKELYHEYLRLALRLSHRGSLIVADNVIRQGKILQSNAKDTRVIGAKKFLQTLSHSRKAVTSVLQTIGAKGHDGISISLVR